MNALEAMTLEHRAEVGKLAMQLALYRAELERHGIEPPDQTGEELLRLWRSSAAVVSTAGQLVAELGPAKEMLFPMRIEAV